MRSGGWISVWTSGWPQSTIQRPNAAIRVPFWIRFWNDGRGAGRVASTDHLAWVDRHLGSGVGHRAALADGLAGPR
jgi:hypothetical protein